MTHMKQVTVNIPRPFVVTIQKDGDFTEVGSLPPTISIQDMRLAIATALHILDEQIAAEQEMAAQAMILEQSHAEDRATAVESTTDAAVTVAS